MICAACGESVDDVGPVLSADHPLCPRCLLLIAYERLNCDRERRGLPEIPPPARDLL